MAHPCIDCGSECYCNGDIDDAIVSKTPSKCESCGCEQMFYEDDDIDLVPCEYCDMDGSVNNNFHWIGCPNGIFS